MLVSGVNVCIGFRFFLNVIHVLQTSKYSETATAIYAVLFLGIGLLGLYLSFFKSDIKLALWATAAPWALVLLFLVLNMIFGDHR